MCLKRFYHDNFADCPGLKAAWTRTLTTSTQFPVKPGTLVEVKCSDIGATNVGSTKVTCIFDELFSFQSEPICTGKHAGRTFHNF